MRKQKVFYYVGKDYYNDNCVELYRRVSRWIKIYYDTQGKPHFRYNNKRYCLDNFMRCDNTIITNTIHPINAKEIIQLAGYETDVYYKPLFVEIDDGGEAVRVYQYIGTK